MPGKALCAPFVDEGIPTRLLIRHGRMIPAGRQHRGIEEGLRCEMRVVRGSPGLLDVCRCVSGLVGGCETEVSWKACLRDDRRYSCI